MSSPSPAGGGWLSRRRGRVGRARPGERRRLGRGAPPTLSSLRADIPPSSGRENDRACVSAACFQSVGGEAWRSARAFARKRLENTVSTKDERSARTVFRKLASGGRVRALPQRLRRAGRATIPIPGTTWVSPPALHPGQATLRRSLRRSGSVGSHRRTPLHPLPPPLRFAGRASLPVRRDGEDYGGGFSCGWEMTLVVGLSREKTASWMHEVVWLAANGAQCLLPVRAANGEGDRVAVEGWTGSHAI